MPRPTPTDTPRPHRRILRILALAAVAVPAAVAATVTGAGAATLADVGWWTQTSLAPPEGGGTPLDPLGTALPPDPTAPDVPEGGIMVEGTPAGATAIGAVRYTLDADETSPVLVLTVADGSANLDGAVILACPAGSGWTGVHGGSWESKPVAGCAAGAVNGILSDDGTELSFPLIPRVHVVRNEANVVIVPGTDPDAPDGANGSTFRLITQPLDDGSLRTRRQIGLPPLVPGAQTAPPPTTTTTTTTTAATSPPVTPPPTVSPPPTAAPVQPVAPALPPSDQGLTATAPLVREGLAAPIPPGGVTGPSRNDTPVRITALALLAAWVGAGVWLSRQPVPEPRSLSRFGHQGDTGHPPPVTPAPVEGGLGRFRRPRAGVSTRL